MTTTHGEPGSRALTTAGLTAADRRVVATARSTRALGLLGAFVLLALICGASLMFGSRLIPAGEVLDALRSYDPALEVDLIVGTVRIPRTIAGILVGAAMGAAGALMQGVSRNPLADPGLLGVNAGAGLFVVFGIYWFGMTSLVQYVWFGFLGAAVTSVAVYALGSRGRDGATPVKLTLAGAAVSILISSLIGFALLTDTDTNEHYRFWVVGSLTGRDLAITLQVLPFIVVGLGLALAGGRLLNAISLGDDVAKALGQRVGLARISVALGIVVLCGAGTAVAGPVSFVGLLVPHVARVVVGPDYRWIIPYSAVLGAVLMVGSDVVGRVWAAPAELPAGLITALIGGPVFIVLARRRSLAEL